MIDVNAVKEQVELLAKKDQSGGMFTPANYNRILPLVVRDIVRKYYGIPEQYQPGMPMPAISYELTQLDIDYLSAFKVITEITKTAAGYFTTPANYMHKSAIRHKIQIVKKVDTSLLYADTEECCDEDGTLSGPIPKTSETVDYWPPIKPLGDEDFQWTANSRNRTPSLQYPILRFLDGKMEVLPSEITKIELTYIRNPTDPVWGYSTTGGVNTYNAATSTQIELPLICQTEVVMRCLIYLGISIREPLLMQWAEQKKNTGN